MHEPKASHGGGSRYAFGVRSTGRWTKHWPRPTCRGRAARDKQDGRPSDAWVMLTGGMGSGATGRRLLAVCAFAFGATLLAACGNQTPDEAARAAHDKAKAAAEGVPVHPPFSVRGDASGLLLVWFDAHGPHTAEDRNAIPDAHRAHVRVDSLRLPPDKRLDPTYVYVADLAHAGQGRELRRAQGGAPGLRGDD